MGLRNFVVSPVCYCICLPDGCRMHPVTALCPGVPALFRKAFAHHEEQHRVGSRGYDM